MNINLEYDIIKELFAHSKIWRRSRSPYSDYDWAFIMLKAPTVYSWAKNAYDDGDLKKTAAISAQWLMSFVEAFSQDAFIYDDEGCEFSLAVGHFSDLLLKVYDHPNTSEELKAAIVEKYDQLNHLRKLDDYGMLDINPIIQQRGWNIEVIDFHALYLAEKKAKEEAKLAALAEKQERKRQQFLEEHFVCDYDAPSKRFMCERILYPIFKRESPNLQKTIIPKLRKICNAQIAQGHSEELMQHLDGHVRAAHIQAVKREFQIASVINNATIRLIKEIQQDEKFLVWIGDDREVLDELDKILSNALKLQDYCKEKIEI